MLYSVAVEKHPGLLLGWVVELPGCVAGGESVAELEARLPLVIAEYCAWAGSPSSAQNDWRVVETIDANGRDILFETDRMALQSAGMELAVSALRHTRSDLRHALKGLPDEILDWEPSRAAFDSFDAWAPDVRSIRGVERHIYQFEAYYRDGLKDGPAAGILTAAGPRDRSKTIAAMRRIAPGELDRVFTPLRPGTVEPEQWTLRKVLRRIISHERAHTAEILQRRTWVLLGPPRGLARRSETDKLEG